MHEKQSGLSIAQHTSTTDHFIAIPTGLMQGVLVHVQRHQMHTVHAVAHFVCVNFPCLHPMRAESGLFLFLTGTA